MKRRTALAILFLCFSVATTHAQSLANAQPASDSSAASHPDLTKAHRKIFDRKFFAFAGLQLAATVGDIETTQWALHTHPNAYEENPIFGNRPGRPRAYGIGLPLTGLQLFLQYRMKKRAQQDGKRENLWIAPATLDIGLQTALALHNAKMAGEPVCPAAGAGCR